MKKGLWLRQDEEIFTFCLRHKKTTGNTPGGNLEAFTCLKKGVC